MLLFGSFLWSYACNRKLPSGTSLEAPSTEASTEDYDFMEELGKMWQRTITKGFLICSLDM